MQQFETYNLLIIKQSYVAMQSPNEQLSHHLKSQVVARVQTLCSLHFGGPIWRPRFCGPYTSPNGGHHLCRLQFAKRVSVTQISDHVQGRSLHFGGPIIGDRMSSGTQCTDS
jgi:hypothetical protein